MASISETHTPQRKGLRSSALRPKKQEPAKQTGPVVIETWVPEEELDLWEIRAFSERSDGPGHVKICHISQKDLLTCRMCFSFHRVEKEKAQAAEQAKVIVVHLKYLSPHLSEIVKYSSLITFDLGKKYVYRIFLPHS